MSQVTKKGDKPASSPRLDDELRFRQRARLGPPSPSDAPPLSTFPGPVPKIHEGQLKLNLPKDAP